MKHAALLAAALVVVANGFALGRVAWNRIGSPDASMTLTERELPIAYSPREAESSAVALRLDAGHPGYWGSPEDPDLDALRWLDGPRLVELGFDVRLPESITDAATFLSRQSDRKVYAVLELQGPAWEAYRSALERKRGPRPEGATEEQSWDATRASRELRSGSRLFIVDAGPDPATLRARHPDRGTYLIVPAKVRAYLGRHDPGTQCLPGSCRARGAITLLIDELMVPHRLHAGLPLPARTDPGSTRPLEDQDHDPRYEVTLRSGALHEPWVEAIRPLAGPSP
jgi:hypothetical protein